MVLDFHGPLSRPSTPVAPARQQKRAFRFNGDYY